MGAKGGSITDSNGKFSEPSIFSAQKHSLYGVRLTI